MGVNSGEGNGGGGAVVIPLLRPGGGAATGRGSTAPMAGAAADAAVGGGGAGTLWAVMATTVSRARVRRVVAEVFGSREAALADAAWREREVRAYEHFLASAQQPVPRHTVAPVRRSELPKGWRPTPALGFLRGRMA